MGNLSHSTFGELPNLAREIFIETGSGDGISLNVAKDHCEMCHSIEIIPDYYMKCVERFREDKNVKVYFGKSYEIMPRLIDPNKSTTFWLDAHYSGCGTYIEDECPLMDELLVINSYNWRIPPVIFIDDAHLFEDEFWDTDHSKVYKRHKWAKIADICQVMKGYEMIKTEHTIYFSIPDGKAEAPPPKKESIPTLNWINPPQDIKKMVYDAPRKDDEKVCFLPFRGEFGSLLLNHAPRVNAYKGYKIVYHEKNYEPFYPDADERYIIDSTPEDWRCATGSRTDQSAWSKIKSLHGNDYLYYEHVKMDLLPGVKFAPKRTKEIEYGKDFDILICPRQKQFAAGRNFMCWDMVVEELQKRNYKVLAVGKPDASVLKLPCDQLFDVEDFTDATLWAIEKAPFIIATASALAHLSLLKGKHPYIIIDERGGNPDGGFEYDTWRQEDISHVGWTVMAHWNDPEWLVEEICHYLEHPVEFNKWHVKI